MSRRIKHLISDTMTVADMIRDLENFDPDAPVVIADDYGDRYHTTQALPVRMMVDSTDKIFRTSAYSNSGVELVDPYREHDPEPSDDVPDPEERPVVVLCQSYEPNF